MNEADHPRDGSAESSAPSRRDPRFTAPRTDGGSRVGELPPEPVPYERYHGAGNEFLLVDARERVPDRGAFAERACGLEVGVGADGVLFLALEPEPTPPRVVMTLFQPDGDTAPMCGNGARCAATWAMERTGSDAVMVDTQAGSRRAERVDDEIAVEMGRPRFEPAAVPVAADGPVVAEPIGDLSPDVDQPGAAAFEVTAVDAGVPHAVAFVESVDAVDLDRIAPPIRHADAFPRGTNVTIASPAEDGFRQRTYERGVEGETDACGTGAVAVASVARRLGHTDADDVAVRPPGGELRIRFDAHDRTTLVGPVVSEGADAFGGVEDGPEP